MQQAHFADLIFSVPVIVAYISKFTSLHPGDVIATGTAGRRGRSPRASGLYEGR